MTVRAHPFVFCAALLALPALSVAATHVVKIDGMAFAPASLAVKRGDTVVWENRDVVPHTATATATTGRGPFDSKQIAPGARWSWTAAGTGRQDYLCTIHPNMKAMLEVTE